MATDEIWNIAKIADSTEFSARQAVINNALPIREAYRIEENVTEERAEQARKQFISSIYGVLAAYDAAEISKEWGIGRLQLEQLVDVAKPSWSDPEVPERVVREFVGLRNPPKNDYLARYVAAISD